MFPITVRGGQLVCGRKQSVGTGECSCGRIDGSCSPSHQVKVAATLSNGEAFNPELIYMLETRKDDDGVHKVSKTSEFVDAVEGQKVLTLFQQLGKQ